MAKAALLVGIDGYKKSPLRGCVADVERLRPLLSIHDDNRSNFQCVSLIAPAAQPPAEPDATPPMPAEPVVTRALLRRQLHELFSKNVHMALFYFSGHGSMTSRGGVIVTQDYEQFDEGIYMEELMNMANTSNISEIILILDCCYSGFAGHSYVFKNAYANLREGVAVLAGSTSAELAASGRSGSVFTSLICEALRGGAADVVGEVTAAGVYDFVEKLLGPWDQRPMFKANLTRLTPLRLCRPAVPLEILHRMVDYFEAAEHEYPLDPEYEEDPRNKPPDSLRNPRKEAIFKDLRACASARLVEPVGAQYLYQAAIESKSCRLTPLGRFYWQRARENKY